MKYQSLFLVAGIIGGAVVGCTAEPPTEPARVAVESPHTADDARKVEEQLADRGFRRAQKDPVVHGASTATLYDDGRGHFALAVHDDSGADVGLVFDENGKK